MIEETTRSEKVILEKQNHENLFSESQDLEEILGEERLSIEPSSDTAGEIKISYLFLEFLVCSLLLWSLIFIKQSPRGSEITFTLQNILSEESQSAHVQEFIEDFEAAIKQIL